MAMSTAADLTQTSTCASLARGRDPEKNRRRATSDTLITDQQKWSHPRKPTARDLGLGLGLAHTGDEAMGTGLGPGFARTGLGLGFTRSGDETRGLGLGPGLARTGDEVMVIGLGLGFARNWG